MRIAMLGRALPRDDYAGGVSGQMHMLATTLARRGHKVTVHALNPPPIDGGYRYAPIAIPNALRNRRRAGLYLAPWWMSRIALDDYDVVHTHGDDHFIRTKRPVVRTFYGAARAEARYSTRLSHRLYHWSMVPFECIAERRATEVVTISASTQQYLSRQAVIIPCGYDPAVFVAGGPKSQDPSILFVGDLGTRKRGDLLLSVFAEVVRSSVPTAELWMVMTEKVASPGVRSFGRLGTRALAELYRQAWVFCLPSRYEGFGVPYLEAMASGTPVVATPNGGSQEVLDEGRSGSIVEEGKLGNELVALLTNRALRETMAIAGLARAKEYDIARIAQQYEAVYERLTRTALRKP